MRKTLILPLFFLLPINANADFWGGDLPLLAEIVFNTLHTMNELEKQSSIMKDEMAGIRDRIHRVRTISEVIQPSSWEQWKDPAEALRRLKIIYHTLPKEYRTDKSDHIEDEISKAMNLVSKLRPEAGTSFNSGKEMERRGADASPGVAQKLAASGIGTLISLESQTQAIQSHVVSLLAQMLANGNEQETRMILAKSEGFVGVSQSLNGAQGWFSSRVRPMRLFK